MAAKDKRQVIEDVLRAFGRDLETNPIDDEGVEAMAKYFEGPPEALSNQQTTKLATTDDAKSNELGDTDGR